jgi:pilus assembly protein CpaF
MAPSAEATVRSWISLESKLENRLEFYEIHDRLSMGTAISSPIRLQGKNFKPLQALLSREAEGISFKEVWNRTERLVRWGKSYSLPPYELRALRPNELLEHHRLEISQYYKKSRAQFDDLRALDDLEKYFFKNSSLPAEIKNLVHQEWSELELQGPVEQLLSDPDVTDILVLSPEEIWFEAEGELKLSKNKFVNMESYRLYLENLLKFHHQIFDEAKAAIDFEMESPAARVHLVGPPLTRGGFYLSVRKHFQSSKSLEDLLGLGMFDSEVLCLLQEAVRRRQSILLSGGTGSGKTTLMGALMREISADHRVVVIEDTPELRSERSNTCFLKSGREGSGVSLRELVRQSLRMRPDRLIIGEVRGEEAWDLLMALNTGHRGSWSSLHANSARDALWRFYSLVHLARTGLGESEVMELITRNIDLVIHCDRNSDAKRKVAEVIELKGRERGQFIVSEIFQWKGKSL